MKMEYLIIGGGAAGFAAALNIRKTDGAGRITVISEETYRFYSRIRLMEYLAGETDEEGLIIYKSKWYEDNRVALLSGSGVNGIDFSERLVTLASGQSIPYDRLLLATGASAFVPPFEGMEKEGIFTLRTLEDAKAIRKYSAGLKTALLVGAGSLGLEAGNALRKRGLKIKAVEVAERLLPRSLDHECAGMLQGYLESLGFEFYLGAKVSRFTGGKRADGVVLEDGRAVQADMALISAGIRPRIELAREAGIAAARGITVDDRMQTSAPGVYAAGDCAEHRGVIYGIWHAAEAQGRVAGINMAGGNALYSGTVLSNVIRVAGVDIFSAGDIDAEGSHEHIRQKDEEKGVYRKLVINDGRITGCILYGDIAARRKILSAIEKNKDISSMRQSLGRWDLNEL